MAVDVQITLTFADQARADAAVALLLERVPIAENETQAAWRQRAVKAALREFLAPLRRRTALNNVGQELLDMMGG